MYQKGLINSVYDYEYKNKNCNIFKSEANKKSEIKRDNTMADKLMYISNNGAKINSSVDYNQWLNRFTLNLLNQQMKLI